MFSIAVAPKTFQVIFLSLENLVKRELGLLVSFLLKVVSFVQLKIPSDTFNSTKKKENFSISKPGKT